MFLEQKKETEKQIKILQDSLDKINYKCWYYETALTAGTAKIHDNLSENNENSCPYSRKFLSEISDAE